MHTEAQTTDAKARLVLPEGFANVTVIIEQISDTELRVRHAKVIPKKELEDMPFDEELPQLLSDRDRDHFLELLANPPAATPELIAAAARHQARRG